MRIMNGMHIADLDLRHLWLVEALARTGQLTAAADEVGLTQSAASHALARLRHGLADPVFVRTSRGMRPTPYGERLAAAAREALAALRGGIEPQPAFDPGTSRRAFCVYMSDVGQMVLLPRLLRILKAEAPGVTLHVRAVPTRAPHALLESGEVDLAVGYFTTLSAGFVQKRLFRERYVCAVRADHPVFRDGMNPEAFRTVPHAVADASGMAHGLLDQVLARHNLGRRVQLTVPQFMVLPLVITGSDLLVVMPSRLVAQFAKLVPLKVMELPIRVPAYDIRLFWHERFRADPANLWLRRAFVRLAADPDLAGT